MPRFCTACGSECRQREPSIFECSNGHRNYINPIPGATVFIVKGSQVLYARRAIEPHKGGLNIVGGIMDVDETVEECAMRECREEFGIEVKIVDYLGSYAGSYGERKTINFVFVAEYVAGEVAAGDDLVAGSHHWRTPNELPSKDELAWAWVAQPQELLKQWFKNRAS